MPLVHLQQSIPCFNCYIVFVWMDSQWDGESSEEKSIATYGESSEGKQG